MFPASQSSGSFQRRALLVDARLVPRSVVGRHGEADVRRTVDRVVAAPQPAAGVLHRQSERRTAAVDIGGGVVGQQGQSVAAVALREVGPVEQDVVFDVVPRREAGVLQAAFADVERRVLIEFGASSATGK